MHAAVELLALLARVVAERRLWTERHDLHRGLRDAQLDEELLDRVRAPLREDLVVDGRPLDVRVARDQHRPGLSARHARRLVLEHLRAVGAEARALEVEVDVGVDDDPVGRRHGQRRPRCLERLGVGRLAGGGDGHPRGGLVRPRLHPVERPHPAQQHREAPDRDHQPPQELVLRVCRLHVRRRHGLLRGLVSYPAPAGPPTRRPRTPGSYRNARARP